ncbi:hypothetical protein BOTBODRAFT_53286 [Botryobasidium botryosum FD-172 SS1]|uniref:Uncharacterized protein n=1 Tax=Botryobasidium botryosum (strain FD-172 SS1) TaxID=930990 RepID=A0A067MST3_BOTB1|nr:hypothetical protein BOTBODRAFT_53286 [Botryobasidium botryosum FD-172 SS1]
MSRRTAQPSNSALTYEAARRERLQLVHCWEKKWVVPTGALPGSTSYKVFKWVKTEKKQEFSDDEDETAEPNVPVVDEEMDDTQNTVPGIEIVDHDPETGPPGSRDESGTPAIPRPNSAAPGDSGAVTRDASPQPEPDVQPPSPSVPHENEAFSLTENPISVPLSSGLEDTDDDLAESASLFAQTSTALDIPDTALGIVAQNHLDADAAAFDNVPQEGKVYVADAVLDGGVIAEDVVNFVMGDGTD